MARHFSHYLDQLGIRHWRWEEPRSLRSPFFQDLQETERLLILVSDAAISPILDSIPVIEGQYRIHFSAATQVQGAHVAHPLMTFASELYAKSEYEQIPFALAQEDPTLFETLLPGLPNPYFRVPENKLALYHALCVMGGSFATVLWQEVFARFEKELGVSAQVLAPFLNKTLQNSLENPAQALTGPLSRGDRQTLARHQEALIETARGPEIKALHQCFVDFYRKPPA